MRILRSRPAKFIRHIRICVKILTFARRNGGGKSLSRIYEREWCFVQRRTFCRPIINDSCRFGLCRIFRSLARPRPTGEFCAFQRNRSRAQSRALPQPSNQPSFDQSNKLRRARTHELSLVSVFHRQLLRRSNCICAYFAVSNGNAWGKMDLVRNPVKWQNCRFRNFFYTLPFFVIQ